MPGSDVVLVTGSSGFIGAPTIRALAPMYRIVGFDRAGDPHPPTEAECVCVDLTSDESVRAGLARLHYAYGNHLASVIHLAAYYDFSGAPSPLYDEVTVGGTARLLEGLRDFTVDQFVFSSTMLVHRPARPDQRIDEDWPLGPTWAYPRSKVTTERLIRERRGDIPVVFLRIAGVYDDEGHSPPLTNQIRRIWERRLTSRFYPASLDTGSSYLHLNDLVDALLAVVEQRQEMPSEVAMLLGEEEVLGYGELQNLIAAQLYGTKWRTWHVTPGVAKIGARILDVAPLGGDDFVKPWMVERAADHYALDTSRAADLLGWKPQHSLKTTLPGITASLKGNPGHWYRENGLPLRKRES